MNVLDVVIILAYFVGMIALGLIANKKQTGVDDYYLGGRAMGALKIGALWMAGWIGGSSVIGTSSNSYSMGITGIWYVGEIAIGCVLFALVMAEPVKRVSEVLQNITFPEMIRARYDQKNSTMASITTILAMIGYTAAQFVAGASILNVLTGWDLGLCYVLAAVVIVFLCLDGRPARRDVYRHRADGAAAARCGVSGGAAGRQHDAQKRHEPCRRPAGELL